MDTIDSIGVIIQVAIGAYVLFSLFKPKLLRHMFPSLSPVIYCQLSPQRITIRNVKSGESLSDIPEMAISTSTSPKKILAVGAEARQAAANQSAEVINPFAHPRSMVSDFTSGEQLLKYYFCRYGGGSFFRLAPRVVMHPLGTPAGGFTQIENRAFHEMALGAGASEVTVWNGRNLTDQELLSRQFPMDEGHCE
jgi:rod shape-determining protein MreB